MSDVFGGGGDQEATEAPRYRDENVKEARTTGGLVGGLRPGRIQALRPDAPGVLQLLPALRDSIASAHQVAEALESRLAPIITAAPPAESSARNQVAGLPGASPVVNELADVGRQIDALTRRLQHLLSQVQL